MGMDLLDLSLRLERRLSIKISQEFWTRIWNLQRGDVQVAAILSGLLELTRRSDLEGRICGECGYDLTGNKSGVCSECGQPIPDAEKPELVWLVLRKSIGEAVGVAEKRISPESWLIKDLGASC